jgi:2'-5' RNA ligase
VLREAGLASIQAIRATHDPQFTILGPHFTLVFPVEASLADVSAAVETTTAAVAPFSFTLRSVQAVRDALAPGGHVFLIPDRGAQRVRELHSRLYSGTLKWAHRTDIPYVPHITVAAHRDFRQCEALATELARSQEDRTGLVETLTIVEVSGTRVESLAVSRLAGPGSTLM